MKQFDLAPARKSNPHVTQTEVAKEFGCHVKSLIDIEHGRFEITLPYYDAFHAALQRCKARKLASKCEKEKDSAGT